MSFNLHDNVQRLTWIQEEEGQEKGKKTHSLKVSEVCTSVLLLSRDRAPTLSRGSLIGWLSADMLPCELMVTKTEHHTAHGASDCCFTLPE